ncbi:peptidyl-prolyl cis-trans isomerase SDCCAG10 [Entomortierella parvispora]|uniref:Peptidyl-prolyl isomerase CWC27 n=1 Tax=Entomortierella parvispora TaxID=205924 RepID=A0A9P3M0A3_9FUNG|nr:peptidyl-prolyl cis-trans isomerase SDCCAG10 [Entomortierella parvispora]
MSNIYLLEPHTNGKVILHSTYGDISIELWPKEAPKACRNFVQLCMEGYYNDTIFHRIVAGFIIQGGDPEGTGLGGESCLDGGKPFQDEFHSRLRFVRRGLVAMANSGVPNDNKSQFFITLDATMELQNKHTIFGKVAGDTIFNVLKIGSLEVDSDERPLYPPKIVNCTIVVNPFDDIVPRVSRRELEAARLRELEAAKKPERQKKLKKNVALLSFEDDAPEEDGEGSADSKPIKKKMLSSHDVLEDDPTLSREVDPSLRRDESESGSDRQDEAGDNTPLDSGKEKERSAAPTSGPPEDNESVNAFDQRMRDQVREKMKKARMARESESSQGNDSAVETTPAPTASVPVAAPLTAGERVRQEIQKLEGDIRKMHNRGAEGEAETKKKSGSSKISLLQLEREKYTTRAESKGSKRSKSSKSASLGKDRELLDKMSSFEARLFSVAKEPEPKPAPKKNDAPPCRIHGVPSCESCVDTTATSSKKKRKASSDVENGSAEEGEPEDESDDDIGWMQHKLVFEKDLKGKEVSLAAKRDDADEYIVIDPLNKAASTTAALAMEQQKKLDKIKRDNRFSQADSKDRDRRSTGPSSSTRRDDRPYDRSSRGASSGSYRQGDDRRSGYDRGSSDSRDRRGGRDIYRDQDRRGGRHNQVGNDRR